eukprot:2725589-Amphidinium_carterae.1
MRDGHLVLSSSGADVTTNVPSELHLRAALTRRGIAFDVFNLLEFDVHSKWVEFPFSFAALAPHFGWVYACKGITAGGS